MTKPDSGLAVRVFANGLGDLGSIPGRVIPKTQKMVLDASLLNTQHYKVRIKGKVEQSREGVAPSPTPRCSSYRKGSLWVTLDYGRQLYFTYYDQTTVLKHCNEKWNCMCAHPPHKYVRDVHIFVLVYMNIFGFWFLSFSAVEFGGKLVGFYGISAFAGYLTPNPFLCE